MRALYRVIDETAESWQKYTFKVFTVRTKDLVESRHVSSLVSYRCDIYEGRETSSMQHCDALERSYVRYVVTGGDIVCGQLAEENSLRYVKYIGKATLDIPRNIIAIVRNENGIGQDGESAVSSC